MVTSETLANLELFKGLPDEALRSIVAFCQEASFTEGTIIFAMGRPADRIYLLLEGTVRMAIFSTPLPEPVTITVLRTSGQVFGWSAVIGSGHYSSAAQAVTNVRTFAIEGQALMDYLTDNPTVGFVVMMRVARVVSQRLGAMRKLFLETVIDYEKPVDATAEN
jgi:CRP-like cAMP-binding protein